MTARFAPGGAVRVADRDHAGHTRTPRYVRGKRGVVERVCGAFGNPEELARGRRGGAPVVLYRVRFDSSEVWPEYGAPRGDSIDVELYEHWLYPDGRAA